MFFDRLFERKVTDVSALTWSELFPDMARSKAGVAVNANTALRVTTVFACTRVLAEGVAQLPINFFDVDPVANTKTKNFTHPAWPLFSKAPNDWMTGFELIETMTSHAVLTGNAFAYLGWAGDKLIEIIPIVPQSVQMIRNVDWSYYYIVTDLQGQTMRLEPENVLHLRGPSWDSFQGLTAIQLARDAIGLAIATEETHASLHANGAQPGGVLSVKGRLDDKARERLKAQWQQFQGGVGNRFKTAVVDIDANWTPLNMNGVDSQHLETRRFQIEEICRALRVFPQLVMHTDKTSTFASAEQFFLAHVTHSLQPWITRWEQMINRVIIGNNSDTVCKFNVNAIMRGDASQRAAFYQAALGGARGETAYMTRNEVRELEDLNPIDGGDKLLIPAIAPPPATGTDANAVLKAAIRLLELKYNDNHDELGRFATGSVAGDLYRPSTKTAAQIIDESGASHYVDAVERRLAASVPTNAPVSQGGHLDDKTGQYTPERQAVHAAILKDIFNRDAVKAAMPAPGTAPVLSILGGRGGSGKSFVTGPGGPVSKTASLLLDSDSIKEKLPGYAGWNAALYHEEAGHVLDQADSMAVKLGINVTHDATLKTLGSSIDRQTPYRAAGYDLHGYFVHTQPEVAAARAIGRANKPGGRYVPPHVILGNTNNEKNFDHLKTGFKKWQVYDNNGGAPKLVAQHGF